MIVKIGIVEDCKKDMVNAKNVMNSLLKWPEFSHVIIQYYEYFDPKYEDILDTEVVDIMIVDLQMTHMHGSEVAEILTDLQPLCKTIFVTEQVSFMSEGYHYRPFGFVVKPIDAKNINKYFISALSKTIGYGEIDVEDENFNRIKIRVADLVYAKTAKNGSIIFTASKSRLKCKLSVKQLKEKYPNILLSTDRSTVVGFPFVEDIDKEHGLIYLTKSAKKTHGISRRAIRSYDKEMAKYRSWAVTR